MDNYRNQEPFAKNGLYDPRFEHENCGIGAVVNMDGTSDRKVVDSALRIVETLEHRAGKDAEGKTGDGVGILLQISHTYFSKVAKEAAGYYWKYFIRHPHRRQAGIWYCNVLLSADQGKV